MPEPAPTKVDPITQEVITEGLLATMAEMRANVMRAAYSTLIALLNDFSCGLFDPAGQLIAQGPDHPGHIVPLPWGVRCAWRTWATAWSRATSSCSMIRTGAGLTSTT